MLQLVPAVLLALLLISPVYAVDPYEGLCTSKQDFNSTATAAFDCRGIDAQACNDAGGNFEMDDGGLGGICRGLELFPDKCEDLDGFTYVPHLTCEEAGFFFLSDPENISYACSDESFFMIVSQAQSNCCGGEENHKDICADLPKPHEAICTSEEDFQFYETATYACKGTNADACTNAGGYFIDDEEKCKGIDSRDKCEQIGFTYEEDATCRDMGYYLSTPDAADLLDCSNFDNISHISQIQTTCCGGAENHKDICPDNPKPYEAFCTSEDDFQTMNAAFYACKGTDADACTDAGGEYNYYDEKCEDIDTSNPDKCGTIAGFTYEIEYTCGQVGYYLSFADNSAEFPDCSNPDDLSAIFYLQSTCCGGVDNHKNLCREPMCTDSTAKIFKRNEESVGCDSITKCDAKTKTHCPLACESCTRYDCVDSRATFEFENNGRTKNMNCNFNNVSIFRATRMCMHSQIKTSCRRTCGLCYDPNERKEL